MIGEFRLWPEQASSIAGEVDALYAFLLVVSGVMTLLIAGLIIYFAIKYRRGSKADRTVGHGHFLAMEIAWIVAPFALTMVMFFWGARLYFVQNRPPAGAMEISGVGRQWMWKFQHPEGNAEINDLHVPLGQPVKVTLISEDVIHSLYVPAFRVKQDVLPGRYTTIWFQPTKVGKFHLFCAEYCGAKHSEMKGVVHVLEQRDYEAWLAGKPSSQLVAKTGSELFTELRCNTCHGADASRAPPLEGVFGSQVPLEVGQTITADESYLRESILRPSTRIVRGYEPIMPSYDGQVTEEDLLKLITEIKSLSKPPPKKAESKKTEESKEN